MQEESSGCCLLLEPGSGQGGHGKGAVMKPTAGELPRATRGALAKLGAGQLLSPSWAQLSVWVLTKPPNFPTKETKKLSVAGSGPLGVAALSAPWSSGWRGRVTAPGTPTCSTHLPTSKNGNLTKITASSHGLNAMPFNTSEMEAFHPDSLCWVLAAMPCEG